MIIGGPALTKYNDRTIRNLTTAPASASSSPGALVHIKTLTASSSATLSFVDGTSSVVLDNTYPIYKFEFNNIHPATDKVYFTINFSIDSGSNYNVTKTTTFFTSHHKEDGAEAQLVYQDNADLGQSTAVKYLCSEIGNDNDQSGSGELYLFNPSSTTFAKYFMATFNNCASDPSSENDRVAGYFNTTSAITALQFKYSNGNMDAGKIKLYGIKDA